MVSKISNHSPNEKLVEKIEHKDRSGKLQNQRKTMVESNYMMTNYHNLSSLIIHLFIGMEPTLHFYILYLFKLH